MTPYSQVGSRSKKAKERISGMLEGEKYLGRHLIEEDSKINGGILVGESNREALVVDRKYGELDKLYEKAKKKATIDGKLNKSTIVHSVYDIVSKAMPAQDNEKVHKIVDQLNASEDRKVALDVFIQKGTGVCRHHAAASAALLERFVEEGHLGGKPSVDRNASALGGHAWCRYTNSAGKVFILDSINGVIGKLSDLKKDPKKWNYSRESDK